jgi:hypothetical protein
LIDAAFCLQPVAVGRQNPAIDAETYYKGLQGRVGLTNPNNCRRYRGKALARLFSPTLNGDPRCFNLQEKAMKVTRLFKLLPIVVLGLSAALPAAAHARERERFVRPNAEGGVTAGRLAGGVGPNGGAHLRGRRTQGDGQGNFTSSSGGVFRGPNGAQGGQAAQVSHNADGSATRQGGFAATGQNGSIQSQGSASRSTDGAVSGQRSTTASGANGNTYQGNTSYTKGDGVSHTATCSDAAGNSIPCTR